MHKKLAPTDRYTDFIKKYLIILMRTIFSICAGPECEKMSISIWVNIDFPISEAFSKREEIFETITQQILKSRNEIFFKTLAMLL